MADIRLQHRRCLFLNNLPESPTRSVPLAGGDRNCGGPRDFEECSTFSGWVGSSTNIGRYGSSSFNRILAMAGLTARWKSMATSISGPTASRIAAILATMVSIIAGVSM